jgi:uncharacterized protein (DUF433 family)
MPQRRKIISDPDIAFGKPVIEGTRISVELILEKLVAGETIEQLLEGYPHLSREDIHTAVEYAIAAANTMAQQEVSSPPNQAPA